MTTRIRWTTDDRETLVQQIYVDMLASGVNAASRGFMPFLLGAQEKALAPNLRRKYFSQKETKELRASVTKLFDQRLHARTVAVNSVSDPAVVAAAAPKVHEILARIHRKEPEQQKSECQPRPQLTLDSMLRDMITSIIKSELEKMTSELQATLERNKLELSQSTDAALDLISEQNTILAKMIRDQFEAMKLFTSKRVDVQPDTVQQTHVMVVGIRPPQENDLIQDLRTGRLKNIKFKFISPDANLHQLRECAKHFQGKIFVMASQISHKLTMVLDSANRKYQLVNGGSSSLSAAILQAQ